MKGISISFINHTSTFASSRDTGLKSVFSRSQAGKRKLCAAVLRGLMNDYNPRRKRSLKVQLSIDECSIRKLGES